MKKLSFLKTLKKMIASTMGLALVITSLWILLSPIQTFAATITTEAANAGNGTGWSNPNNIKVQDTVYAATTFTNTTGILSANLIGTSYNFSSIPEGAVIESITATINRYCNRTGNGNIIDYAVYLVNKQKVIMTSITNKAKNGLNDAWPTRESSATYTWAKDELSGNLTIEDIKSLNFGIALKVQSDKNNQTAYVNSIQIAVTYAMAPTLSTVNIVSNNNNKLMAKVGDKVALSFTANEAIKTPAVTIAGNNVPPTKVNDSSWKAEYIIAINDIEGAVTFNIAFSDLAGNAGKPVTTTTDSSSVIFDKTNPVITLNGAAKVTVGVGETYTDEGAAASDNYYGNITDKIVKGGAVDTSNVGTYTLTYDVTDESGNNAAQVTRIVNVAVLPSISLDTNVIKMKVNDVYGKMYFLSTASVTDGFDLVECGVVMAKDITGDLDLNNNLVKLPAPYQSPQGQFYSLFNVSYDLTIYVKSYITYIDVNGVTTTRYSNIAEAKVSK